MLAHSVAQARRTLFLVLLLLLAQSTADQAVVFGNRLLENSPSSFGSNTTPTPSPAPAATSGSNSTDDSHTRGSSSPTSAPAKKQSSPSPSASSFLFTVFIFSAAGFLGWIVFDYCRKKREIRMLDERSRAADRVLGDMQMIPQDDYDNEII
jgi:hypothetical protein